MTDYSQLEANAEKATKLLKTMSNQHRLMILCALQQGELSVSQLNELFPIAQSTLSQHLAWLRRESYVKTRRDAQTIYYALDSQAVIEIISVLHKLYCD
ncbi:ArsR family transcriptional regulator [Colwellia sp. MT41]|uniref:Transcriptional regulator n=1 Tax=Colwellia marinimaniae TaxID=1513592 RepID=A0ABQ0MXL4_9GAMM|nr:MULTISPECIES: metalloregulator ArsR/SmtB family transcription factor [Colwellia]ALO35251.1 ArsR family transcriptional regulator [Colwellia sp. MT41]GAW97122.1 transcriptional regulator [Colwellia marinimaniae]